LAKLVDAVGLGSMP